MGIITFNGTSSTAYNLNVEICPSYPVPERVVEHISVMGRNGDLLFDTEAYRNVEQRYQIWFDGRDTSFQEQARKVAMWLYSTKGYCRLEDSYDTDVYRMATISQKTDLKNFMNLMGRGELVFDCKPQRFLKSGEAEINIMTQGDPSAYIYNNTYMASKPLFILTGNGTICQYYSQAGYPVQGFKVKNNSGKTIYVDCETQNAWSGNKDSQDSIVLNMSVTYQQTAPIFLSMNCGTELWVDISSLTGKDSLHFTYNSTGNVSTAYQTLTNSTNGTYQMRFERDSYGNKLTWYGPTASIYDVHDLTISIANYVPRNSDIERLTTGYAASEIFPVLGHGTGYIARNDFSAGKMIPRYWTL